MKQVQFLKGVLDFIMTKDQLHYKKIRNNLDEIRSLHPREFDELLDMIIKFYRLRGITAAAAAQDYLRMVNDMRVEGIYFKKNNAYSCKNQHDAYLKVYSNTEVMNYYMNALLLSQVLWTHHFKMFISFKEMLSTHTLKDTRTILDIGPGHGFFSYLALGAFQDLQTVDIVDISQSSLDMTKSIVGDGNGKIDYFLQDIFEYEASELYDLIILGEVLEHLDEPLEILKQLSKFLSPNGHLWITTPTNAPALDHVYLFKNEKEIVELLQKANYKIVDSCGFYSEDVKPEVAERFKVSYLYGALMINDTTIN